MNWSIQSIVCASLISPRCPDEYVCVENLDLIYIYQAADLLKNLRHQHNHSKQDKPSLLDIEIRVSYYPIVVLHHIYFWSVEHFRVHHSSLSHLNLISNPTPLTGYPQYITNLSQWPPYTLWQPIQLIPRWNCQPACKTCNPTHQIESAQKSQCQFPGKTLTRKNRAPNTSQRWLKPVPSFLSLHSRKLAAWTLTCQLAYQDLHSPQYGNMKMTCAKVHHTTKWTKKMMKKHLWPLVLLELSTVGARKFSLKDSKGLPLAILAAEAIASHTPPSPPQVSSNLKAHLKPLHTWRPSQHTSCLSQFLNWSTSQTTPRKKSYPRVYKIILQL